MFESTQKITENIDLLESRIRKKESKEVKRLRIGTHETLAINIWPQLIEDYQTQYSNHLISITSSRIDHLTQQVLRGELDLILTVTPIPFEKLKTLQIYSDNFAFYVSPKFKGISKKTVTLHDLSQHPILTDGHAHLAQNFPVARAMSSLKLYSSSFFQLNSFEASIRLAEKGLGVALLPTKIAKSLKPHLKMSKLRVKDIPKDYFKHHVYATYKEDNPLAENMAQFIKKQFTK